MCHKGYIRQALNRSPAPRGSCALPLTKRFFEPEPSSALGPLLAGWHDDRLAGNCRGLAAPDLHRQGNHAHEKAGLKRATLPLCPSGELGNRLIPSKRPVSGATDRAVLTLDRDARRPAYVPALAVNFRASSMAETERCRRTVRLGLRGKGRPGPAAQLLLRPRLLSSASDSS